MSEISENNSELDKYGVWIKKTALDANEKESLEEPKNEDFSLPEISDMEDSFSFDTPDILSEENENEEIDVTGEKDIEEGVSSSINTLEEGAIANEIPNLNSFESNLNIEQETVSTEEVIGQPKEDETAIRNDGDIDLSAFMDDSSVPSDGDVDLSAFMGSGDETVSFGDGDIDLSAFMGGESFATEKEEAAEIEDAEPLDIDLEFEETDIDFQENNENDDSSFTAIDSTEDNFDSLFEDIKDEAPDPTFTEIKTEEIPSKGESMGSGEEIDLSDFGFSDESDNLNPVIGDGNEKKVQTVVDYNMNIDIEDDDSQIESSSTEVSGSKAENTSEDEDITVDISMDQGKAEQKEQKTDLSSPDDSFDIDSIFSNIEDENGETVKFDVGNEKDSNANPIEDSDSTKEELDVIDTPIIMEETSIQEEVPPLEEEETEIKVGTEDTTIEDLSSFGKKNVAEKAFSEPGIEDLPPFDGTDFSVAEETVARETITEPQVEDKEDLTKDFPSLDETDFSFEEEPLANDLNDETQEEEETIDSSLEDLPSFGETDLSFTEETVADTTLDNTEIETDSLEDFRTLSDSNFSFEDEASENNTVTEPYVEEEPLILSETEPSYNDESTPNSMEEDKELSILEENDFPSETFNIEETQEIEEETSISQDEITRLEEDLESNLDDISEPILDAEEEKERNISEDVYIEPEDDGLSGSILLENEEGKQTTDALDVSSYIDKKPEYDMTGVSVTLDNLKEEEIIEEESKKEERENFNEDSSLKEENFESEEEEKHTYSVFVKTDDSSSKVDEILSQEDNNYETCEDISEEQMLDEYQENKDNFNSEKILSKIAEDLASLKTEINGLKDEFEEIKKNGIQKESEKLDSSLDRIALNQPAKENSGFFSNMDEDDTIALSRDELGNILNSAEFTEIEEDGNKEEKETIEELETIRDEESLVEDEITVPTVEDKSEEEKLHVITDDDIPSPTLERFDLPPVFDENGFIEKAEPLTEENLEYLTSEVPEEMQEEEDENLEVGISEQPVEGVFSNWQAANKENEEPTIEEETAEPVKEISESTIEEPIIEPQEEERKTSIEKEIAEPELLEKTEEPKEEEIVESTIEETVIEPQEEEKKTSIEDTLIENEPIAEKEKEEWSTKKENLTSPSKETQKESSSNEIPSDMKEEIKSVLSYMDQLLENLPEEKIAEFARSEQFETYKKLFTELGLV